MKKSYDISVVIPVLNEQAYIVPLVEGLLSNTSVNAEVLICDGGSTDNTRMLVAELQRKFLTVQLVNNPERYVSHAFNNAYRISTGKYICLLGAHAHYPPNFLDLAFDTLESGVCDAVGGPLIQKGKTSVGKAIAFAMSSKFGVGGTEFRTETKRMYVDSVAFAVYRKSIFEQSGLLDTDLIRNQDDELHYRLNKLGFRILMIPEIACEYYVRDSLSALRKQYFGYGLYKPLVFAKVKQSARLRHLVPPAFACYCLLLPLAFLHWIWLLPLLLYICVIAFISYTAQLPLRSKVYLSLVYPTLHLSYGLGFLLGVNKYLKYTHETNNN